MAKAPAFQFYVRDWLSDPQLRMASYKTKGIWIDMICFMWEAPDRGIITGTMEDICRMMGLSFEDLEAFITDVKRLDFASVRFSNTEISIENRRMVRDANRNKNNALYQARHRSKHESKTEVSTVSSSSSSSSLQKKEIKKEKTRKQTLTDEEYFAVLKNNPAYRGIDVDRERAKCEAWCLTNNKLFSRRRFINWLNRVERPMTIDRPIGYDGRPKAPSPLEEMKKAERERDAIPPTPEEQRRIAEMISNIGKDK